MTARFDTMAEDELPMVLEWAKEEGWNPGLEDAAAFYATDPAGFFVARMGGDPVAAISVVNHNEDIAFLGLYLCHPDWRGQGIGKALWDHALAHAGQRTIGLDAVAAQQANYIKSGFVAVGETTRLTGHVPNELPNGASVLREAQGEDLSWMAALDRTANGYSKQAFLGLWCRQRETRKTFVLDQKEGFATIRKCVNGTKIGPLVAKTAEAAKALMHGVARIFDGPTTIDLPADNGPLADYCRALGMRSDFTTSRMYRGTPPVAGLSHRAIATLELG